MRYIFLILSILITLHFLLSYSSESYGRATSIGRLKSGGIFGDELGHPSKQSDTVPYDPSGTNTTRRANAALVVLARNNEWHQVVTSMKQLEQTFNKKYGYPWVFLNDEPFSDEFKKWTSEVTGSETSYGVIPREHWVQPEWVDEDKASAARQKLVDSNVIYGGSVPYRNMCRFNSGFFFRHELLQDYRYYWRVEPGVDYFCDVEYDPFLFMQDNNKVYGFTITIHEYEATIPTLWQTTKDFMREYPQYIAEGNGMAFLSDNNGDTYNLCHFWSNFEIADMDFWRGEAYMKYFEYLESKGGFYYERWGDAPVHSIGAALFAKKEQLHFFEDIGYRHNPYTHCPKGDSHAKGKCSCNIRDTFDYDGYACTDKYDRLLQ